MKTGKPMESFIFGESRTPDWFNKESNAGRVKVLYEDDEIVGCQIVSGTKTYTAKVGDSIVNTKHGVAVIPKSKAQTYGIQKKDVKPEKEIKKENNKENKQSQSE